MKIFTTVYFVKSVAAVLLLLPLSVRAQTAFMKVVSADGTGDYSTVQAAVDAAPKDGTRTLVFIRDGFYKEQVTIPPDAVISLIGESRDGTVISHDLSHTMGYEDASETSTIYVDGNDFYGDNFTTQNTVGPNGGQAECFTVASDRATLRHVNLKANQDGVRFFTNSRSYLKDCYIEGTVDYIYDSGIAFIDDCVIKQQTGECIMPREGVFARVLKGGEIHVGDEVTLLPPLEDPPLRAAVITLSDKGSRGEREDKSGPLIVEMLTAAGYVVEETMLLPDEAKALKAQLIRLADGRQVNLILTTGGTGFSPRDITPEATYAVADRNAPGIAEAMRYHSLSITPRGMLSRAASVLRGKTLIVNLPGSPKAVKENLEYILPSLGHGVRIAAGLDGECARK